jgi:signal peptidase I
MTETGPRRVRGAWRPGSGGPFGLHGLRGRLAGPWRVAVAEASMTPSIDAGDWLLVDPSVGRWPRRGTVVVFREPGSGTLAIKRVAGRPGDWIPFAGAWLRLADDEAWLLSDADDAALAEAGNGKAVDSRAYGPVRVEALVGRAWFRYWPVNRVGRLPIAPTPPFQRGPGPAPATED